VGRVKRVRPTATRAAGDGGCALHRVNAPEINHERIAPSRSVSTPGSRNIELIGSRRIRLEFDTRALDDYGRTLAYVFLPDGSMVNEKLLQSAWRIASTGCRTSNTKPAC